MSAIYCSQGHSNSSNNRFCRLCGEALVPAAPIPAVPAPAAPAAPTPAIPNPNDTIVGQRYRLRQQLGHGGFGKTYLAEDINRFNEPCVLKEFAPQVDDPDALKKAEQLFEREAGVLYQLKHRQIPQFRELLRVELEGRPHLFLVQDYIQGQNYQELLERRQQQGQTFTEAEILQLFKDILPVLDYIHHKNVIHRDISPDNLMRREGDRLPVLIDFGGVKQAAISVISGLGEESQTMPPPELSPPELPPNVTIVGKHGYAPHEQMTSGDVEPHNDFYALAMTALVLLTGHSPHLLLDPNAPQYWQSHCSLSPLFTRVLRKMLSIYPSDRYTSASAILTTLFPPPTPSPIPSIPVPQSPAPQIPIAPSPVSSVPAASPISTAPISTAPISTAPIPTVAVAPGFPAAPAAAPVAAPPVVPLTPIPAAPPVPPSTSTSPNTATTVAPAKRKSRRIPSTLLALLCILGIGTASAWVGSNIPRWIAARVSQTDNDGPDDSGNNAGDLDPSPQFSTAEQQRKTELRNQRDRLRVSEAFLVQITDQSFYQEYPNQRGRALTASANDAQWREKWDAIAAQWLDQLDTVLDADARSKLGRYGKGDRDQWKAIASDMNLSSRALNTLTDVTFFAAFPDQQGQDFLNQPMGQIWHGIADAQVRQWQSGKTLDTIQFDSGKYSKTLRQKLQPGQGHTYRLNAQQGQILRLNLDGPRTLLSLYVPSPTGDIPFLLEDSLDQTWSGQLPQSGIYEIVVILDHPALSNRATNQGETVKLNVTVDNVSTPDADSDA